MNDMGEAAENVVFHRFSLTSDEDIPLMYTDIASINAAIDENKKSAAAELLNVITDAQTLVKASMPANEDQYPQYLLAARGSVYDTLAESYPTYSALKAIVSDPACRVFRIRPSGRELMEQAKESFEFTDETE